MHRRTAPVRTQVIVEEESRLEVVKQDIKNKRGIQHKFLSFRPSLTGTAGFRRVVWQGILFQDNRAIGKLCSPAVSLTPLEEDPTGSPHGAATAVHQCSLSFDSWVPAGAGSSGGSGSKPLRIPVDSAFQQAELSVQVIGRQASASGSFALPHRYTVHGKELAAQLQVELQRQGYIRKHQAARSAAAQQQNQQQSHPSPTQTAAAAAPSAAPTTVTLESGDEVERLLSVFEVRDRPAWLKSLVCKFLVAEAPAAAEPAGAAGPAAVPHVAPLASTEEGAACSSGSAAASSPQRKKQRQPSVQKQPRRKQAGAGTPARGAARQQQQQQAGGGEEVSLDCSLSEATLPAETLLAGAASPRQLPARKSKKKKARAAKGMQGEQQDLASGAVPPAASREQDGATAPGEQREAAARAAGAASELEAGLEGPVAPLLPSQGRLQGQQQQAQAQQLQRRAPRDAPLSPSHAAAAKPRRPQRRAGCAEQSAEKLPPPPGLHLAQAQDLEQVHRAPQHGRLPSAGLRQPAGAVMQTRWARKVGGGGSGRGPHRGPPASGHGSSSDVSSEVASIGRPASVAGLSSCSSSPSTEPADLPTPTTASAGVVEAGEAGPGTGCPGPLDSPEALRQLAESLLPHERPQPQQPSSPCRASTHLAPEVLEAAPSTPLEQACMEAEVGVEAGEAVVATEAKALDALSTVVPLLLPSSAAVISAASSEAAVPSPHSSAPSTPRSSGGGAAASDSHGYPSSTTSSPAPWGSPGRHPYGMPYPFGSSQGSGWTPSPESSSGSFQRYDIERGVQPAKLHHGRMHSGAHHHHHHQWHSSDSGSTSGWSQPPSRLGQAPGDRQGPALRGQHGAGASWPPPPQEQRQAYGSPAMAGVGGAARSGSAGEGMLGHGQATPPPLPAAAHPVLYQQRYLQQQQYMQQAAMLAALQGHGSTTLDSWQQQQGFDTGYQQQHAWRQGGGAAPQPGLANGYAKGHGRFPQGGGAELCAAGGAGYGPMGPQHPARQWYSASAPASRCGSLTASPVVGGGPKLAAHSPLASPQLSLPAVEPLQLQVMDSLDDSPDLERFLAAVTPAVPLPSSSNPADLTLADVWQWFELPSLFGQEVVTLGGPRGPAASYYLPYLSAVQLFVPAGEPAGAESLYSCAEGLEEWPATMRPLYQWFAGGHVGERVPLAPQLDALCGGGAGVPRNDRHPLLSTRIADLHPYSWFSVAWYPLYRIPEAPLDARFLTYYSLAPLWQLAAAEAAAQAAAGRGGRAGAAATPAASPAKPCGCCPPVSPFAAHAGMPHRASPGVISSWTPTGVSSFPGSPTCSDACTRTTGGSTRGGSVAGASGGGSLPPSSPPGSELGDLESPRAEEGEEEVAAMAAEDRSRGSRGARPAVARVPVVGLQWYTMARSVEVWTETLVAAKMPEDVVPGSGTMLADGSRIMGCWRGVAVVSKPYPSAKGGPIAWEVQLEELAGTAGRLATGHGLQCRAPDGRVAPAAVRCPDHEFFSSRAWTCRSAALWRLHAGAGDAGGRGEARAQGR